MTSERNSELREAALNVAEKLFESDPIGKEVAEQTIDMIDSAVPGLSTENKIAFCNFMTTMYEVFLDGGDLKDTISISRTKFAMTQIYLIMKAEGRI